jgi:hypothetical protein
LPDRKRLGRRELGFPVPSLPPEPAPDEIPIAGLDDEDGEDGE